MIILLSIILSLVSFLIINNFESFQHLYKVFSLLFDFGSNPILALSGGRFSNPEGRGLDDMIFDIFSKSPLFGFGLGSTKLMDNGFIEIVYQGGFICLIIYIYIS